MHHEHRRYNFSSFGSVFFLLFFIFRVNVNLESVHVRSVLAQGSRDSFQFRSAPKKIMIYRAHGRRVVLLASALYVYLSPSQSPLPLPLLPLYNLCIRSAYIQPYFTRIFYFLLISRFPDVNAANNRDRTCFVPPRSWSYLFKDFDTRGSVDFDRILYSRQL